MSILKNIISAAQSKNRLLAILIDPDKFEVDGDEKSSAFAKAYLKKIPAQTTHLFIGGSTDHNRKTEKVVQLLKAETDLPILLFPGDYTQVTPEADALLFLSLLSGDNPEFLIGQQVKAARVVQQSNLEVIPTGYLLIDGGSQTAVERVSNTQPLSQDQPEIIITTALAGQYLGKKLLYLEAGSGARSAVQPHIIASVCEAITIPIIVGGGIRTERAMQAAFTAGATMVVVGTAFEDNTWNN
ncbi:phosphoglycerol geranylgeranyltransferase [Dokdonia donghaensis]|uniref:Geranylgeranylglyceryl phosphate synthase n=1 Tax=Dokdonia donghaensis DSW-1 TaxID=1300343 RepID=A0A0A2GXL2_9FLAO|nr:geranylgeranylglyceryl/heptaprenylglyceryl phosphate synthase [Dokdonia donghaensis]ANH59730.1 geranylgeranylglyceryl phosphate synthase-like protein [Dokdonia donghaensis DSW-1]KGO07076.1 geranylgeranylglyceryl phosphate synthase [Dokdonia donghaensis DSW-1]